MAAYSFLRWLATRSPAERRPLGLPPATPDRKAGKGRKKQLTPEMKAPLAARIEERRREIDNCGGRDPYTQRADYKEIHDQCSRTRGLASVMLEQYYGRLVQEGLEAHEALRRTESYSRTSEFKKRLNTQKVALSTYHSTGT